MSSEELWRSYKGFERTAARLATRSATSPLIFYGVSLISAAPFIVSLTHGPRLFPLINYRCRSITPPILNHLPRSSPPLVAALRILESGRSEFRRARFYRARRWLDNYGRTVAPVIREHVNSRKNRACTWCVLRTGDSREAVNKAGARFPT